MRILILNWRCPRNPDAGGAEMVTQEIARRLVRDGDSVEWFSARFPGAPAEETIDGVHIVRAGRQATVHAAAYLRYRSSASRRFDLVVDEVNTIPFFAPLWAGVPVVMFMHQLAREVWWYESPFPLSVAGFLAEPAYLRIYRDVPVITVSASTREGLRRLGFRGSIEVIAEGIEPITEPAPQRPSSPRFLYVGRLAPSKRVGDVIRAFATFCATVPGSELRILGDGPGRYLGRLRRLARDLGVADRVSFLGRVRVQDKHIEMATAHMLLLASVREGWGLVVTEANALGTPAVAYRVPGLQDSIRDRETGLLVDESPEALCVAMKELWNDRTLYDRLSAAAQAWSATFSFDTTASQFRKSIAAFLPDAELTVAAARSGTSTG